MTDNSNIEQSLKLSEEKYRLLADNITDLIWVYNVDRDVFTYVSPSIKSIFGYSIDETINNLRMEHYLDSKSILYVQEKIKESIEKLTNSPLQPNNFEFEVQAKKKDGNLIWIDSTAKPRYTESGEIEFVGVSRDIDKRKKLELEIQLHERQLKLITDNVPAHIALLAKSNQRYLYVNRKYSESFGIPQDKIIGMHPKDVVGESFHVSEPYLNKAFSGQSVSFENSYNTIQGQRHIMVNFVPDIDDTGQIIGVLALSYDITDRKKDELLILEQNFELKKHIDDKNRFIQILSHDLKNPFNSLMGFTDLLLENLHEYSTDKIEKLIKIINQTTHKTYDLLTDLLLWSKSQANKMQLKIEECSFIEITSQILDLMIVSAKDKGISINCIENEHIKFKTDKGMFKTILRNLITNAIKFTNNHGQINIFAEKSNDEAIITISDNGIGIDAENIPKLWDFSNPFTTRGTKGEGGTGFGLILCKEFVEKLGGKIWVESVIGKGSDFKFTMPLCEP